MFTRILSLNLLLWVLLINFRSYQVLLEFQAYEKCLLRAYSTRLTTFVFTVMVISASTSFLTRSHGRTHGRTHARLENPYIEVRRAHLKIVYMSKILMGDMDKNNYLFLSQIAYGKRLSGPISTVFFSQFIEKQICRHLQTFAIS